MTQDAPDVQPKAGQPGYVDCWDHAGAGMWYVHIEPTTLSKLWSEEQDTLYINATGGQFWLSAPHRSGETPYETLDQAKDAGDTIAAQREAGMAAAMLADAGLDASVWNFEQADGARFRHASDPDLVIEIWMSGPDVDDRFMAWTERTRSAAMDLHPRPPMPY